MSKASCRSYAPPTRPLKWEEVAKDTDRLRVDGGWLYRVVTGYLSAPVAMQFVPDPKENT